MQGLTAKQERAIVALLIQPTLKQAAEECGITQPTLWRWMQEPVFLEAYKAARKSALESTLTALQSASGAAVETLREVMTDQDAKGAERVSAARAILEFALKAREVLEVEERLTRLEERIPTGPTNLRKIK